MPWSDPELLGVLEKRNKYEAATREDELERSRRRRLRMTTSKVNAHTEQGVRDTRFLVRNPGAECAEKSTAVHFVKTREEQDLANPESASCVKATASVEPLWRSLIV